MSSTHENPDDHISATEADSRLEPPFAETSGRDNVNQLRELVNTISNQESPALLAEVLEQGQGLWRYIGQVPEASDVNPRPMAGDYLKLGGTKGNVRLIIKFPERGEDYLPGIIPDDCPYPLPAIPDTASVGDPITEEQKLIVVDGKLQFTTKRLPMFVSGTFDRVDHITMSSAIEGVVEKSKLGDIISQDITDTIDLSGHTPVINRHYINTIVGRRNKYEGHEIIKSGSELWEKGWIIIPVSQEGDEVVEQSIPPETVGFFVRTLQEAATAMEDPSQWRVMSAAPIR